MYRIPDDFKTTYLSDEALNLTPQAYATYLEEKGADDV